MKLSGVIVLVLILGLAVYLWESSGDDDDSDDDDSGSLDDTTTMDGTSGSIGDGGMKYTGTLVQTEEGDNLTAYPDAGGFFHRLRAPHRRYGWRNRNASSG